VHADKTTTGSGTSSKFVRGPLASGAAGLIIRSPADGAAGQGLLQRRCGGIR
jgi:hypothetical protein